MAIEGLPQSLTLEIVTPDHSLVTDKVDEVVVPAAEGYLGVLPGHTPLLATLAIGEMWYRKGTEKTYLSLAGGFVEVLPDKVTVLAQIAERAEDIDITRAERAKQRAEERLARPAVEMDLERARAALLKSMVRLQVSTRARTRV
jgi:F-type H+-transporting ATPase subunit epsilon